MSSSSLHALRPPVPATGATAVLLGRPMFFSLAVGGQDGVARMLSIIKDELEAAMALCGCQVSKRMHPRGTEGGAGLFARSKRQIRRTVPYDHLG